MAETNQPDPAWDAFDAAMDDPNTDTTWADDLPEAPELGETVAIFVPTKSADEPPA